MEGYKTNDAAALLESHISEHGVSQNLVAKSCGVSASALSQWLKGVYAGDSALIESKVRDYIQTFAERRALSGLSKKKIIPTANFKSVQRLLNICLTKQIIGMLVGEAGFGKTTAVRDFVLKRPSAILISAKKFSPNDFFNKLAPLLGFGTKGSVNDKFDIAVEKLKDSGRLLIIDEAEYLPSETLDYIRWLYDDAGVGIALCGKGELEAGVFSNRAKHLQLSSRVSVIKRLDRISRGEIRQILDFIAPLNDDAFDLIYVKTKGNNRILAHICDWLSDGMKAQNSAVITKEIAQAAIDMVPAA